ncbi:hypothetical protein [uncultured Azohydromonas sp.]|jgi:hypothetical protein|uniref:hypothetical protein n=1 Tax=uncultured Azohydromonas sp. TaxID=487342 RepID=UPI0026152851|nr:hypothetical protein [uncultured Azohydromonas sp.]
MTREQDPDKGKEEQMGNNPSDAGTNRQQQQGSPQSGQSSQQPQQQNLQEAVRQAQQRKSAQQEGGGAAQQHQQAAGGTLQPGSKGPQNPAVSGSHQTLQPHSSGHDQMGQSAGRTNSNDDSANAPHRGG